MLLSKEELEKVWEARGVEQPCPSCHGLGRKWYSDGSTWRKAGMAVQKPQMATCDTCWGSGCLLHPGVDLRSLTADYDADVKAQAAEYLEKSLGLHWTRIDAKAGVHQVAEELRKLSGGRKARPLGFYSTCTTLADFLDFMVMKVQERNR